MTQEDAALRERVRKVLNQALGDHDQSVTHWTDQLLAAIPEPAATPTPPRVELDTGWAEWEGDAYRVHLKDSTSWTTISAVVVAHHGVADHAKRDAKVAELLALKQPAVRALNTKKK